VTVLTLYQKLISTRMFTVEIIYGIKGNNFMVLR